MMRKRVLLVSNLFPLPTQPNRSAFNRQHYQALQAHMDVRVICPVAFTQKLAPQHPDFSTAALPETSYHRFFYTPGILRRFYGVFMWHSIRRKSLAIAREFKPHAIIGSWAYPDGYVALRLAQKLNIPCAVQVLGSDVNLLDTYKDRAAQTWATLREASVVLPVSQALKQKINAQGIPDRRVRVVYRGINRELFAPRNKDAARKRLKIQGSKYQLLFVGNLVPVKSVETLIDACALMEKQGREPIQVNIVGDGTLRGALEKQVERLHLSNRVTFHGLIPHADLPDWYAACDLFVLPSLHEGVPNVLLEAMACGLPYVASQTGGIPEISGHDACRLFQPGDAQGLADAIVAMMTETATPSAENLPCQSWAAAGEALAAVIEDAIAGYADPHDGRNGQAQ